MTSQVRLLLAIAAAAALLSGCAASGVTTNAEVAPYAFDNDWTSFGVPINTFAIQHR